MGETLNREQIESTLIQKAWADEGFKKELLSNPKDVLIKEGIVSSLPEGFEINVVEESAKSLYLVIPLNPENLPDEALDMVAGGGYGETSCFSFCFSIFSGG